MGKRPKTKRGSSKPKTKTKAKSEPAKAKDLMKMPPESVVRSLARDIRTTIDSKVGLDTELRDVVAEAKKEKGVHPGALKRVEAWVNKAKKTDRGLAAIATEMAHLDYYRDVLGLDELLKKQGQMFARPEAGEKPQPDKQLTFGSKQDAKAEPDKTDTKLKADAATAGTA